MRSLIKEWCFLYLLNSTTNTVTFLSALSKENLVKIKYIYIGNSLKIRFLLAKQLLYYMYRREIEQNKNQYNLIGSGKIEITHIHYLAT